MAVVLAGFDWSWWLAVGCFGLIFAAVLLAAIGIGCVVVAGRAADDEPYGGEGWS